MYGEKEYAKRIKELEPLAVECLSKKSSKETRDIAINMHSEDAYIFGVLIGMMNMMRERNIDIIEVESFVRPLKLKNSKKRRKFYKEYKEEIAEEKSEKDIDEKSEKDIDEKSEKDIDEKSEKDIDEKSEKDIDEKSEKDIDEKSEKDIDEKSEI